MKNYIQIIMMCGNSTLKCNLQKAELHSVIINDPANPITDAFTNKYRKASAIINLLIEDDQITYVKNLETVR